MNRENKITEGQIQLDDRNNCQPLDKPIRGGFRGGGGRGGRGPPFQFVGDLFFVKIYNKFIIL